ncbi:hypothetical protein [Streptomyces sp. NPDC046821]|uniref:hypothetical protein n=1 Tax=Streptomyces sp. NPDC046821 TaxID=3154702 RepID=UPI0033C71E8C
MRWHRGSPLRTLVRECEILIADLPIPSPFSVEALIRNMEGALGRRITLIPMDFDGGLGTACGLRVKTQDATMILYQRRPTRNQTVHVILHEAMHEWLDHGTSLTAAEIGEYVPEEVREKVLARFPWVSIQGRVNFNKREEKQVEVSASLVKRTAYRQSLLGDDMVSLLENSLSHPVAPPGRRRSLRINRDF